MGEIESLPSSLHWIQGFQAVSILHSTRKYLASMDLRQGA